MLVLRLELLSDGSSDGAVSSGAQPHGTAYIYIYIHIFKYMYGFKKVTETANPVIFFAVFLGGS